MTCILEEVSILHPENDFSSLLHLLEYLKLYGWELKLTPVIAEKT